MTQNVALNFETHSAKRIITDHGREFGDNVMFAPVFPHEFRQVQASYPIVFIREGKSEKFRPVALFGLEKDENLYLKGSFWDANYIPLAVRMPPFTIGRGPNKELSVNVDLQHPRVSERLGEELFYSNGEHTPFLTQVTELLLEIHHSEQALPLYCALLDEMQLIEPFTLEITLIDGTSGKLAGYHTIAEEKLRELEGNDLERLQGSGYLMPTFMIVASLAQLGGLIERRNASLEMETVS